jgi:hypothetical protein
MRSTTKIRLPEFDTAFEKVRQFNATIAIKILNESPVQDREFIKIWALARLLAWTILDQPGSRHRRTKASREFRTRNSRSVGHLTLARTDE